MNEFLVNLDLVPLAAAASAAAYLFGVASGWLIWGGHTEKSAQDNLASDLAAEGALSSIDDEEGALDEAMPSIEDAAIKPAAHYDVPEQAEDMLQALEEELRTALQALEHHEQESGAYREQFLALDHAIKCANGRLKRLQDVVEKNDV